MFFQAPKGMYPVRSEIEPFDLLIRWLTANGMTGAGNWQLSIQGSVRGLAAKKDLQADSVVFDVPEQCFITSALADKTEAGQKALTTKTRFLNPADFSRFLILVVVYEEKKLGPGSCYFPYINMLPSSFLTNPCFYTEAERKQLKGSQMLDIIDTQVDWIRDMFKISEELGLGYNFQEFALLATIINSRLFSMEKSGREAEALVPLLDLLNHSEDPHVDWWYNEPSESFQAYLARDVAAGGNVYTSYGNHLSNAEWLLDYGFVPERNPDNTAILEKRKLAAIFMEEGLDPHRVTGTWKIKAGFVTETLELFDNVWIAVDDQIRGEEYSDLLLTEEITSRIIRKLALRTLKAFPSTISEDTMYLELFKEPNLGIQKTNLKNILMMRRSEMLVLHWLARSCTKILESIDMSRDEFFYLIQEFELSSEQYSILSPAWYIVNRILPNRQFWNFDIDGDEKSIRSFSDLF
jgi:hypothetical protein